MEKENQNQEEVAKAQELRAWCLENAPRNNNFFETCKWLEQGIQEGDLKLRKFCITHCHGIFKTPQDAFDWINTGTIPPYLESKCPSTLGKTDLSQVPSCG